MPDNNPQPIDPRWAWERYRPTQTNPWDLKKVGHLYRRAAFGATRSELETGVRIGVEHAVANFLQARPDAAGDELFATMTQTLRQENSGGSLPALWLYRMLYSTNPLREKMTLFWHNHFATSNLKVQNGAYMLGQYELMRRHALGNFRTLLTDMSTDPAMMVWLDTIQSRRGQPNENYARELMELFSLGIRHPRHPERRNYSEQDIREAARAFTGWTIVEGRASFDRRQHDDGEKNVLGQRGRWQANDIVRICLEQEAAPYFIVRKLFRFLVSDTMEPGVDLLEPLVREFRAEYNFGALVEKVLRSNLFFSAHAYRTKIKSPVEFGLGLVRGLEGHQPRAKDQRRFGPDVLAGDLERLGQKLFFPPSVAGWDGGRAWLNGQTFLLRQNLALGLTSGAEDRYGRQTDPAAFVRRHQRRTDPEIVDSFLGVFLQGDIPAATRTRLVQYLETARRESHPVYWTEDDVADHRVRTLAHLVLCLPEIQLC